MANENQQNDVPQQPAVVVPGNAGLSKQGASRRRFARVGAGASGVLLTLVSQPGLATCNVCKTPSGYQSFKTNGAGSRVADVTCTGKMPLHWKSASWPSGCKTSGSFGTYFNCNNSANRSYGTKTCLDILSPTNTSGLKGQVAMYLMAAYLNVLSKKSTFITTTHLTDIWKEYSVKSIYTPTAGVTWDAWGIIEYLSGTMEN